MAASETVRLFLNEPWLFYNAQPSDEAVNVGLPLALKHAEEYPIGPGVSLDYFDDSTPEGVVRVDIVVPASGQNLFHYRHAEPKHPDDPRVVYYVHGGGFVRGNGKYCRGMGLWALRQTGLPVYTAEYSMAPERKWPANLDDLEAAWNHLTEDLGHAAGDLGGISAAVHDGGLVFGHHDLPGGAQLFEGRVLQFEADCLRDHGGAGENGDVL